MRNWHLQFRWRYRFLLCCTLPMRNWHIICECLNRLHFLVVPCLWGIDTNLVNACSPHLIATCCTLPMRNWHFSCPAKFVFVFISCTLPMRNWHVTDIQLFLIHDYIYNLCCTLPMRNWHFNNAVVSFHIFCCTLPMRNWHIRIKSSTLSIYCLSANVVPCLWGIDTFFLKIFLFYTRDLELYLAYEELTLPVHFVMSDFHCCILLYLAYEELTRISPTFLYPILFLNVVPCLWGIDTFLIIPHFCKASSKVVPCLWGIDTNFLRNPICL